MWRAALPSDNTGHFKSSSSFLYGLSFVSPSLLNLTYLHFKSFLFPSLPSRPPTLTIFCDLPALKHKCTTNASFRTVGIWVGFASPSVATIFTDQPAIKSWWWRRRWSPFFMSWCKSFYWDKSSYEASSPLLITQSLFKHAGTIAAWWPLVLI